MYDHLVIIFQWYNVGSIVSGFGFFGFVLFHILLTALIASLLNSEMSFKCKVNFSPHQKRGENQAEHFSTFEVYQNLLWNFFKNKDMSMFFTYKYDSHLHQIIETFVIESLQYRWRSANYHKAFLFSKVWST